MKPTEFKPEIGEKLEADWIGWQPAECIAYHDGKPIIAIHAANGVWIYQKGVIIRPIRTNEEVERDRAVEEAMEERPVGLSTHEYMILSRYTGRLYDAGMLRKPLCRNETKDKIEIVLEGRLFDADEILDALGL